MKKYLFLLLALLCFKLKGQVDSFQFQHALIRVNLPHDWITESKKDSIFPDNNWNLVIKSPIETVINHSLIFIRFKYKNDTTNVFRGIPHTRLHQTKASRNQLFGFNGVAFGWDGSVDTHGSNPEKILYNSFTLNDSLVLETVCASRTSKKYIDSLCLNYYSFLNDFIKSNSPALKSLFAYNNFEENWIKDSTWYGNQSLYFNHPNKWKFDTVFSNTFFSKDHYELQTGFERGECLLAKFSAFYCTPPTAKGSNNRDFRQGFDYFFYKMKPDPAIKSKIPLIYYESSVPLGICHGSGIEYQKVYYLIIPTEDGEKCIAFTFTCVNDDPFVASLYENAFRYFIQSYLDLNHLN